VALHHGTHRAVEDQDALLEEFFNRVAHGNYGSRK
jgi:hypothetical protein